jgi:hypothetical protein
MRGDDKQIKHGFSPISWKKYGQPACKHHPDRESPSLQFPVITGLDIKTPFCDSSCPFSRRTALGGGDSRESGAVEQISMASQSDNSLVHAFGWVALVACLWLPGCKWADSLRGDNFTDEFAHWGENQRIPTEPGQMYGFSEEARQVERNLGVR